MRKLKEKEDRKRYRKKQWQDIKWSAEEFLLNFLLKLALPTLVSIATSIATLAILRKILG